MRKTFFLLLLFAVYITTLNAQIIDRAPSNEPGYRAIEGGSEKVNIDSTTPLPDLIKRLEKQWEYVDTGKMYWIGYTDDMFSIAAHKDSAIVPLLRFISTTKNAKAKLGAITTIHLIGINSTIAGRYTEHFVDKNAREALLTLLDRDDNTATIISLLIRDPWRSDVPKLFDALSKRKKNYWSIINGLSLYHISDFPLMQPLPEKFRHVFISINSDIPTRSEEESVEAVVHQLDKYKSPFIVVDPKLLDDKIIGDEEGHAVFSFDQINKLAKTTTIASFLQTMTMIDYTMIGNKIQYNYDGEKLNIWSPQTTRQYLLDWWTSHPISFKQNLNIDKAN